MSRDSQSRAMCAGLVCALIALSALPRSAAAAEELIKDELHLRATFSLWATSVDGSMDVGPLSADFDVCFTELIQQADYAFNPGAELSKGKWSFIFDMTIAKVSAEQSGPLGLGNIDAQITISAYEFLIGYTAFAKELDNGMTLTLTPVAGAQLTYGDAKINPELLQSVSQSVTFVDPVIGGRVVLGLTPKLAWRTGGIVGGFGVGSELTWAAGTFLDWKFAEKFQLSIGYRAIYWDYELGTVDTDLLLYGPWMGLTWEIF